MLTKLNLFFSYFDLLSRIEIDEEEEERKKKKRLNREKRKKKHDLPIFPAIFIPLRLEQKKNKLIRTIIFLYVK
jgi:hypothetical protein